MRVFQDTSQPFCWRRRRTRSKKLGVISVLFVTYFCIGAVVVTAGKSSNNSRNGDDDPSYPTPPPPKNKVLTTNFASLKNTTFKIGASKKYYLKYATSTTTSGDDAFVAASSKPTTSATTTTTTVRTTKKPATSKPTVASTTTRTTSELPPPPPPTPLIPPVVSSVSPAESGASEQSQNESLPQAQPLIQEMDLAIPDQIAQGSDQFMNVLAPPMITGAAEERGDIGGGFMPQSPTGSFPQSFEKFSVQDSLLYKNEITPTAPLGPSGSYSDGGNPYASGAPLQSNFVDSTQDTDYVGTPEQNRLATTFQHTGSFGASTSFNGFNHQSSAPPQPTSGGAYQFPSQQNDIPSGGGNSGPFEINPLNSNVQSFSPYSTLVQNKVSPSHSGPQHTHPSHHPHKSSQSTSKSFHHQSSGTNVNSNAGGFGFDSSSPSSVPSTFSNGNKKQSYSSSSLSQDSWHPKPSPFNPQAPVYPGHGSSTSTRRKTNERHGKQLDFGDDAPSHFGENDLFGGANQEFGSPNQNFGVPNHDSPSHSPQENPSFLGSFHTGDMPNLSDGSGQQHNPHEDLLQPEVVQSHGFESSRNTGRHHQHHSPETQTNGFHGFDSPSSEGMSGIDGGQNHHSSPKHHSQGQEPDFNSMNFKKPPLNEFNTQHIPQHQPPQQHNNERQHSPVYKHKPTTSGRGSLSALEQGFGDFTGFGGSTVPAAESGQANSAQVDNEGFGNYAGGQNDSPRQQQNSPDFPIPSTQFDISQQGYLGGQKHYHDAPNNGPGSNQPGFGGFSGGNSQSVQSSGFNTGFQAFSSPGHVDGNSQHKHKGKKKHKSKYHGVDPRSNHPRQSFDSDSAADEEDTSDAEGDTDEVDDTESGHGEHSGDASAEPQSATTKGHKFGDTAEDEEADSESAQQHGHRAHHGRPPPRRPNRPPPRGKPPPPHLRGRHPPHKPPHVASSPPQNHNVGHPFSNAGLTGFASDPLPPPTQFHSPPGFGGFSGPQHNEPSGTPPQESPQSSPAFDGGFSGTKQLSYGPQGIPLQSFTQSSAGFGGFSEPAKFGPPETHSQSSPGFGKFSPAVPQGPPGSHHPQTFSQTHSGFGGFSEPEQHGLPETSHQTHSQPSAGFGGFTEPASQGPQGGAQHHRQTTSQPPNKGFEGFSGPQSHDIPGKGQHNSEIHNAYPYPPPGFPGFSDPFGSPNPIGQQSPGSQTFSNGPNQQSQGFNGFAGENNVEEEPQQKNNAGPQSQGFGGFTNGPHTDKKPHGFDGFAGPNSIESGPQQPQPPQGFEGPSFAGPSHFGPGGHQGPSHQAPQGFGEFSKPNHFESQSGPVYRGPSHYQKGPVYKGPSHFQKGQSYRGPSHHQEGPVYRGPNHQGSQEGPSFGGPPVPNYQGSEEGPGFAGSPGPNHPGNQHGSDFGQNHPRNQGGPGFGGFSVPNNFGNQQGSGFGASPGPSNLGGQESPGFAGFANEQQHPNGPQNNQHTQSGFSGHSETNQFGPSASQFRPPAFGGFPAGGTNSFDPTQAPQQTHAPPSSHNLDSSNHHQSGPPQHSPQSPHPFQGFGAEVQEIHPSPAPALGQPQHEHSPHHEGPSNSPPQQSFSNAQSHSSQSGPLTHQGFSGNQINPGPPQPNQSQQSNPPSDSPGFQEFGNFPGQNADLVLNPDNGPSQGQGGPHQPSHSPIHTPQVIKFEAPPQVVTFGPPEVGTQDTQTSASHEHSVEQLPPEGFAAGGPGFNGFGPDGPALFHHEEGPPHFHGHGGPEEGPPHFHGGPEEGPPQFHGGHGGPPNFHGGPQEGPPSHFHGGPQDEHRRPIDELEQHHPGLPDDSNLVNIPGAGFVGRVKQPGGPGGPGGPGPGGPNGPSSSPSSGFFGGGGFGSGPIGPGPASPGGGPGPGSGGGKEHHDHHHHHPPGPVGHHKPFHHHKPGPALGSLKNLFAGPLKFLSALKKPLKPFDIKFKAVVKHKPLIPIKGFGGGGDGFKGPLGPIKGFGPEKSPLKALDIIKKPIAGPLKALGGIGPGKGFAGDFKKPGHGFGIGIGHGGGPLKGLGLIEGLKGVFSKSKLKIDPVIQQTIIKTLKVLVFLADKIITFYADLSIPQDHYIRVLSFAGIYLFFAWILKDSEHILYPQCEKWGWNGPEEFTFHAPARFVPAPPVDQHLQQEFLDLFRGLENCLDKKVEKDKKKKKKKKKKDKKKKRDKHRGKDKDNSGSSEEDDEDEEEDDNTSVEANYRMEIGFINDLCPRGQFFYSMSPFHIEAWSTLARMFAAQKTPADVLHLARALLHDHSVNPKVWYYGLIAASIERPDMLGLSLAHPLDALPDLFIPGHLIEGEMQRYRGLLPTRRRRSTTLRINGTSTINPYKNIKLHNKYDLFKLNGTTIYKKKHGVTIKVRRKPYYEPVKDNATYHAPSLSQFQKRANTFSMESMNKTVKMPVVMEKGKIHRLDSGNVTVLPLENKAKTLLPVSTKGRKGEEEDEEEEEDDENDTDEDDETVDDEDSNEREERLKNKHPLGYGHGYIGDGYGSYKQPQNGGGGGFGGLGGQSGGFFGNGGPFAAGNRGKGKDKNRSKEKGKGKGKKGKGKKKDKKKCIILDGSVGLDNGVENKLWYWREDLMVNQHHFYWHQTYPVNATRHGDRRAELFFMMHRSMLARYNAERLSNGFPRTQELGLYPGAIIEEPYNSHLKDFNSNSWWTPRPAQTPLRDVLHIHDPDYARDIIINDVVGLYNNFVRAIKFGRLWTASGTFLPIRFHEGIQPLANTIEATNISVNPLYYDAFGLHNLGHIMIGLSADPDYSKKLPSGIMGEQGVSMRDPSFYTYHTILDNLFEKFKQTLPPYKPYGGVWPLHWHGVELVDVKLVPHGGGEVNHLTTFYIKHKFQLEPGVDRSIEKGIEKAEICAVHLDHAPFQFQITIDRKKCAKSKSGQGTVRIFMAPRYNEDGHRLPLVEQRRLMFQLDAFQVELKVGRNLITRNSRDNALTKPWSRSLNEYGRGPDPSGAADYCGCGWPHHLFIPKGKVGGMAFDLFVMVTNFDEDFVADHPADLEIPERCNSPYIFCGLPRRRYPDHRPMGYPFDRPPYHVPARPCGHGHGLPDLLCKLTGRFFTRPVGTLEEYVKLTTNMAMTEFEIKHIPKVIGKHYG